VKLSARPQHNSVSVEKKTTVAIRMIMRQINSSALPEASQNYVS